MKYEIIKENYLQNITLVTKDIFTTLPT